MSHTLTAVYVVIASRLRELRDRGVERGLTTTEVAVLTFTLVVVAASIGGAIYAYAQNRVNDINNVQVDPTIGN